jgi:hypothetical protein
MLERISFKKGDFPLMALRMGYGGRKDFKIRELVSAIRI